MQFRFAEDLSLWTRLWQRLVRRPDWGWRLLLFALFWITLSLFLHFREVRVEFMDLGAPATRYVVAQVDFDFLDQDLKMVLQQQATQDIGAVSHFESEKIEGFKLQFDADLVKHPEWRERFDDVTFQKLYEASQKVATFLKESCFSDERTLRKLAEVGYPQMDHYYLAEQEQHQLMPVLSYWKALEIKIQKESAISLDAASFIVQAYRDKIGFLIPDPEERIAINQYFDTQVPKVRSRVIAGTKIIGTGDVVTPRHLAQLQAMKKEIRNRKNLFEPFNLASTFLLGLILVTASALALRAFDRTTFDSTKKLYLLLSLFFVTLLLAKGYDIVLAETTNFYLGRINYPIVVPLLTMMAALLINIQTAFLATFVATTIMGMTLAVEHSRFLILNMITGLLAIYFVGFLKRRKEVFVICFKIFLITIPALLAFATADGTLLSSNFILDLVASGASLFFIAMLIVTLLPLFESLFGVMTDMSLMEWLDPSLPLLRRLSVEAPGTYQHSLGVSYLAEAAAGAIGANALFCRVAALYHDIGKITSPNYFAENLSPDSFDIHKLLKPTESAVIIINHVIEGIHLAERYKLPSYFIDIIKEHHGTTLVHYFYCKQIELMGGDADLVDSAQFRYPGPKPQSKESVILMIADTIEASTRSLDQLTVEAVTEWVDRVVSDKMDEGQFDESIITFKELGIVKATMVKMIVGMYHHRPKYPPNANRKK